MLLIAICGISIICILYFIFRGESYKKTLAASKRETSSVKHQLYELSGMVESLSAELSASLAFRIRHSVVTEENTDLINYSSMLVNALPSVISSTINKGKTTHESLKDYCSVNGGSVTEFELFLSTQSEELLKAWKAKDVLLYVQLCRMLIDML